MKVGQFFSDLKTFCLFMFLQQQLTAENQRQMTVSPYCLSLAVVAIAVAAVVATVAAPLTRRANVCRP